MDFIRHLYHHMENQHDHKLNRYIFLSVIILLAVFLLFSLMEFFTAFLAATMFYVLSKQFVEWLTRKKHWRKAWAALLVILISFCIILLPISLLAAMLFKKAQMIGGNMEAMIVQPLKNLDVQLQERFHIALISANNIEQAQTFLTNFISSLLNQGLSLFGTIIMMYFFLYFMIVNINRMEAAILFYLPFKKDRIEIFGHELKAQTFSNAVGIPLIAVMQGLVAYISFLIGGVPEAGFWAVITGGASILPIIGTGLVWIPVGIYLLFMHQTWQGLFVLGWGFSILSVTDNVVRFLLAKWMADVHPIVTVLGVIIGIQYFGITGLVFGPLLISYFLILLRIYYVEYQKPFTAVRKRKIPLPNTYFNLNLFRSKNKQKPVKSIVR